MDKSFCIMAEIPATTISLLICMCFHYFLRKFF